MMVGKALRVLVGASVVVALGLMVAPRRMEAQDPVLLKKHRADPELPAQVFVAASKPAEPSEVDIPDDPPPHEGAMFGLPNRIAAPDIIQIEVLEALPGRPITGEHLVRPDGTISLGFYGDIQVNGLTTAQVKEKVIIHLRSYLTDESLGLIADRDDGEQRTGSRLETPPTEMPRAPDGVFPPPTENPAPEEPALPPKQEAKPKKTTIVLKPQGVRARFARLRQQDGLKSAAQTTDSPRAAVSRENTAAHAASGVPVAQEVRSGDEWQESLRKIPLTFSGSPRAIPVHPRDSDRVHVDIASYNSKVYFVLGDVNSPGRLPWTGNETVLDALQFAGGLDPSVLS